MHDRETSWQRADQQAFDALIIGGGINGSCLFNHLTKLGYRVLLVDRGDFSSGTSQASGMMIWGGLLYLRNLDLSTVLRLSRDRDSLIRELEEYITPKLFRYIPSVRGNINPTLVETALFFYWSLGMFRRKSPRREASFEEACLLRPGVHRGSLLYEEAALKSSDARFTLHWLTSSFIESSVALNYCSTMGSYSRIDRWWHLELKDTLGSRQATARARLVINCAGIWTDEVNRQFGIETPFKHALSKGVYISVKRPPDHKSILIFEMGEHRDVITFVPWGPVSLWGPTETFLDDVDNGAAADPIDIQYLLERMKDHLHHRYDKSQIISIRCGIRPLAVSRDYVNAGYPLDLSRKQYVVPDENVPWVSSYGGKITGCRELAYNISRIVTRMVEPSCRPCASREEQMRPCVENISWPGFQDDIPSPDWCARHELCCTLEDYLRRRTNISQWIPRLGLGRHNEHQEILTDTAMKITGSSRETAEAKVRQYKMTVERRFDRVLERV